MTLPVYTSIFGDRVQTKKKGKSLSSWAFKNHSEVICPYQMGTQVYDLNSHRAELAHSVLSRLS